MSIVEDIELNREIAEVILTETGFLVESAPDGTDAVAMVKKSQEYLPVNNICVVGVPQQDLVWQLPKTLWK